MIDPNSNIKIHNSKQFNTFQLDEKSLAVQKLVRRNMLMNKSSLLDQSAINEIQDRKNTITPKTSSYLSRLTKIKQNKEDKERLEREKN